MEEQPRAESGDRPDAARQHDEPSEVDSPAPPDAAAEVDEPEPRRKRYVPL